ncbi:MAG: hypothetical protein KC620_22500, partial [Myxococcales bacterium]|nr:hypothetical protein [Myxococcales bacterium]
MRDADRVARGLDDPSLTVRTRAAGAAARIADAKALTEWTLRADRFTARKLISTVSRCDRRDVARALVPGLLAAGRTAEAARLLPLLDEAGARQALTEVEPPTVPWRRLAWRHPELVLASARAALAERPTTWRSVLATRLGAWPVLAGTRPDALLALFADAGRGEALLPLQTGLFGRLALHAADGADRVAALWLVPERRAQRAAGLPTALLKVASRLPERTLGALAERMNQAPSALAALLAALPPARRASVFDAAVGTLDTEHRIWPDALLTALPHARRFAEAAR